MDEWASGKSYSGRVSFVCVSCAGAELASTFATRLKLSKCTLTYAVDDPTWGQLGCNGFIVLDGSGRVVRRATAAYMEEGERAFRSVESLLDTLLEGTTQTGEALAANGRHIEADAKAGDAGDGAAEDKEAALSTGGG